MLNFGRPELWLAAVLMIAGAVIAETAAIAQGASPLTFLDQVYKPYNNNSNTHTTNTNNNNNSNTTNNNKNAKGIDYSKPDIVRRHFGPQLAKAMVKDMADAKKKNEAPLLNADPFVDAQDWDIANLKIEMMPGATRRNASALVTFTNAGKPSRIALDLMKTGDGWRIYEIEAPSGSLRERYKLKP